MPKFLSEQEKQEYRDLIFNKAIEMFDESGYGEITMSKLAKRCDIAKGTIFKYYETKETLFSGILYHEYTQWYEAELEALSKYDSFDKESYISFTKKQTEDLVDNRYRFLRLASIKRTILDKNVKPEVFLGHVQNLTAEIREIARVTAGKVDFLTEDELFDIYQSRHFILIGCHNLALSRNNKDQLKALGKGHLSGLDIKKEALRSTEFYLLGLYASKEG